jgi:hypothetical protein
MGVKRITKLNKKIKNTNTMTQLKVKIHRVVSGNENKHRRKIKKIIAAAKGNVKVLNYYISFIIETATKKDV